ncbi:putative coenzyme A synthetase [Pleomassaria siparia CBS 279.74]|uniref:Putative coenzyme A synthetase n=1 Tax=Pleomassaria siparia CBS 279.74 TaxID=1314801 RepID=A0A6G1KIP7_9PLEO|nr:putative coenzyme A synthetase [Pleomassaria siparia CBS 279.74]
MTDYPILVGSPGPGVVKITLNRPSALNAINADLLDGLTKTLRAHQDACVILIEGAGDRSFCAGEDLKQTLAPRTGSAQELRDAFSKLQDITRLTSSSQAVVVAAVQGFAIGGGAEIALAADFVIGGPKAKFRFPEVTLGHAITGGISLRLTQLVGLLKAKELLITGRWVDAGEALKFGMLSEVAEDPKRRAEELAVELAGLPAIAMASSKMQLERAVFTNMEACLQDEVNVASYCFAQSDADQAFANFATRKSPSHEIGHRLIRDINSALKYAVKTFPNRTWLRMAGADVSFSQCDEATRKLAGGLRRAGIQRNDRVLVMMRNSVETVYSWLAANRLGAVYVPVNVELKSITLKHVAEAANPKIAIVDAELLTEFRALGVVDNDSIYVKGGDGVSMNAFSRLVDAEEAIDTHVEVTPATTAAFLYTSGTTGKSKPCVLSHEYFILQAKALIEGCSLQQDDVLYCPFPLFHADATALMVVPAILLGAVAALSARFSASRFWDEIRDTGATVYDFMGATLTLTYKQPPSLHDRDHKVRLAWGVPIPHFAKDYEECFGHSLITLYGSVEASLPVFQQGELPFGSCGRSRKGFQLRIANDMDEEVPPNMSGQLLLRSDQPNAFFDGYFNDAINTTLAFRSLWLHTGDLAKVDEVENVYFLGRVKDVIRRRGENVNASEVEEELLQHPDVVIAAAYGIPSQFGEGTEEDIKVAVQLSEGSGIDEGGLWEWAKAHMARFQVPDVIERVEEIKRTPTGKMEKYGLGVEGGVRFDGRK